MSAKKMARYIINIMAAYMVVWGAYTCITCNINYMALPVFIVGLVLYISTEGGDKCTR